jgi:serine/threonine protein kinase
MTLDAGDHIGPFRLVERIGAGGMGEVWSARDDRDEADPVDVAVKIIAAERLDAEDGRIRFEREIEAARRIESEHVAAVLEADGSADRPWLASQLVAGRTLAARVNDQGPLHDDALRRLALGLARGLDAVHRAGVVHRDLTPGNVVLGPSGPVIVDFGVSRIDDTTTITQAGALVGTPAWMAPEQLRADEVSDASDVWAWGVSLAFAATGRPPVTGDRTETVIARVLDGSLDLEGLPPWLQPLVEAATDIEPARRPTADELIARLDRSARGLAGADVTRVDLPTEVAPGHVSPTLIEPAPLADDSGGRDWKRVAIRAGLMVGAVALGAVLPALVAIVVSTLGVLAAVVLRIWTEERRLDSAPIVNAGTVLVASLLLLVAGLSTVLGVWLAIIAVVALVALFVAVGGDIG